MVLKLDGKWDPIAHVWNRGGRGNVMAPLPPMHAPDWIVYVELNSEHPNGMLWCNLNEYYRVNSIFLYPIYIVYFILFYALHIV